MGNSTNRRCQIVIEKYPNDYGAAMGDLRIRGHRIGKIIQNGVVGKERKLLWDEYHEIRRLLDEWSKTVVKIKPHELLIPKSKST